MGFDAQLLTVHVFSYRHIFHFWRYEALLGIGHLRDGLAWQSAIGKCDVLEAQFVERFIG